MHRSEHFNRAVRMDDGGNYETQLLSGSFSGALLARLWCKTIDKYRSRHWTLQSLLLNHVKTPNSLVNTSSEYVFRPGQRHKRDAAIHIPDHPDCGLRERNTMALFTLGFKTRLGRSGHKWTAETRRRLHRCPADPILCPEFVSTKKC